MVQKINPHPAPGCNRSPSYFVFSKDAILGSVPSIASEVLVLPICFREIKLEWPILISASPRVELCLPITTRSCLTKYSNSFPWIFAIAGGPPPRSDNGVLSLFFKDDPEAGEELVNRVSNYLPYFLIKFVTNQFLICSFRVPVGILIVLVTILKSILFQKLFFPFTIWKKFY